MSVRVAVDASSVHIAVQFDRETTDWNRRKRAITDQEISWDGNADIMPPPSQGVCQSIDNVGESACLHERNQFCRGMEDPQRRSVYVIFLHRSPELSRGNELPECGSWEWTGFRSP